MDFSAAAERERVRNIISMRRHIEEMKSRKLDCKIALWKWRIIKVVFPWKTRLANFKIMDAKEAIGIWESGIRVLKSNQGVSV